MDIDFYAVLTRVTGTCNASRDTGNRTVLEPVILNFGKFRMGELLQQRECFRALNRDLCITIARIHYLRIEAIERPDVFEVFLLIRGVYAQEKLSVRDLVHQDVVD